MADKPTVYLGYDPRAGLRKYMVREPKFHWLPTKQDKLRAAYKLAEQLNKERTNVR